MNHTNIEWVKNPDGSQGFTWNPITGCLNHTNGLCKGGGFPCYAYRLAHGRLRERYTANKNIAPVHNAQREPYHQADDAIATFDPFYPRFWPARLYEAWDIHNRQTPKGIFCCDMSDLFGIGIPESWTGDVLDVIRFSKQHRFYLLTKQPQNLPKWSPFPDNCWVGVTVTSNATMTLALTNLANIKAKVKFISFEPLLGSIGMSDHMSIKGVVDWVIIGAQTGPKKFPRWEWVREIIEAADKAGARVFLKDNLGLPRVNIDGAIPFYVKSMGTMMLRQEMPNV
jgi:protein gp37